MPMNILHLCRYPTIETKLNHMLYCQNWRNVSGAPIIAECRPEVASDVTSGQMVGMVMELEAPIPSRLLAHIVPTATTVASLTPLRPNQLYWLRRKE